MQYLSSYFWQQEKNALTSLVLQQLVYRKGKVPVLFACICTGASTSDGESSVYFAEQLTEWFWGRHRSLSECVRKGATAKIVEDVANGFDEVENELRHKIAQIDRELSEHNNLRVKTESGRKMAKTSETFSEQSREETRMAKVSMAVILCAGNRFWLFSRGNMGAYLLNSRFERANCVCLSGEDLQGECLSGELEVLSGLMEADIGLLLATGDFIANMTEQELLECLALKEINTQEQGERRLKELGTAAELRGGHHMGAILMVTG